MDSARAELEARIAALERENDALRRSGDPTDTAPDRPNGSRAGAVRSRWWGALSLVLIMIGVLLAPVAVLASSVRDPLSNTDAFVAQFAPLVKDPAVQRFLTESTVDAIDEHLKIDDLASSAIDGVTALGTSPTVTAALDALKAPAAAGIRGAIDSAVTHFVESERFETVWRESLRVSHSQLVLALDADDAAALRLGQDGSIGIALGPIVGAVQQQLVDQGFTLAERIPAINRTIVIGQSDSIPQLRLAYHGAIALGAWLPIFSLILVVSGVVLARRRVLATVRASIVLAVVLGTTWIALSSAGQLARVWIGPSVVPSDVVNVVLAQVADPPLQSSGAVMILALVVAAIAWLCGPFAIPQRLRAYVRDAAVRVQAARDARRGTGDTLP